MTLSSQSLIFRLQKTSPNHQLRREWYQIFQMHFQLINKSLQQLKTKDRQDRKEEWVQM